jgi:outer membrane protein assembly complex protein YaeT
VCLAFVLWVGVCAAQQPDSLSQAGGLNNLQGIKVAAIEIKSPSVEHPEWLAPLLPQKANEPLDKYKVRRSVQALYDTGRFAEIQVEAQRNPQGEILLTFAARENFFFGSIRVEGAPSTPTDNQLVNATRLALGEQFTEEKIKAAIQGIHRSLQEDGYYKAVVQPFNEWDSRNQQVKVLFTVEAGAPAKIGAVYVTGSPGVSDDEVRDEAGMHAGDRVSSARLTRALQRLRKSYQKNERLEAQVTVSARVYHPETNTLDYTFDIVRGPQVDVKVEGAKLSRRLIKKLVPIFEENAVDEDLLNEGARNIRDYFQTQGHFDAEVTYTQEQAPGSDRRYIVYQVNQGARSRFVELELRGNKYFRSEDIRERMAMQPAGGLILWGVFSQSLLARDIQSIQNLYQGNGFLQVKVTPEVQDNYQDKGRLKVTLTITEGPQSKVGKLVIEGNSALTEQEIRSVIAATEGQPYSDAVLVSDQTEVMDAYYNRGFSNVRFDYSTQAEAGDPTRIDVTYKISEGPQIYVDKVLISGLHFTRPKVVDREMKINADAPISQQQMLDSQRRLYDMGLFNEVNMAVQNPEGESTHKNINFQLSEAKRYTFNYGAGLQVQTGQPAGTTNPQGSTGVSPNVSFDATRQNFRGRNHTVMLKTRYGNLDKMVLIGYVAPRLLDSENFSLDFTSLYEQTNDVKTYTARRLEGSVEVKHNLDRATTLLYRAIYRRVSTSNLVIDPNLVPLFSQPVRVGMPDFNYLRNTRDSDIESHKGSLLTLDLGVASRVFGSQPSFVRISVQNSSYYQFYKRRWVLARSTRVGAEEPFAGTSAAIAAPTAPGQTAPPPSSFVPLPERFLAGGSTTHRGFGVNQAGPRDLTTGFQLGGEALFLNNVELRTPPLPFPWVGNNLSAAVFNDIGNVFTTPVDMVHNFLRYKQQNRASCLDPASQSCSFNYMSVAVGAGIRYRTPVGPVSFDIGYNLNPPAFPINHPSDGSPPRADVLRHFNFFFNIGQTF